MAISSFLALTILIIIFLIPYLFNKYISHKKFPYHSYLTVSICWFFALSYVLILCPIDLTVLLADKCNTYNINYNGNKNCLLTNEEIITIRVALENTYRITYWIVSFFLGWILMDLQSGYLYSGEFNKINKLYHSLKINGYGYAIILLIGVPIFIGIWNSHGINYAIGFVFAISNLFSLFCITLLMSYGLVNIPYLLYYKVYRVAERNNICFEAWNIMQQRHMAEYDLRLKVSILDRLSTLIPDNHELRVHLSEIRADIPEEYLTHSSGTKSKRSTLGLEDVPTSIDELDEHFLARIRENVRDAVQTYQCMDVQFGLLVNSYIYFEDLANAETSGNGVIDWSAKPLEWNIVDGYIPTSSFSYIYRRIEYLWYIYLKPFCFAILLLLSIAWSSFTVVAEMSTISGREPNLSLLSKVYDALYNNDASIDTTLFVLLMMMGYQVLATYFSFFQLKLGSYYRLYTEQQSQDYFLVTNGLYLARFAPALIQNFLKLLRVDSGPNVTSFSEFFGFIDLIPFLGSGIEAIFPLLLGIMIIITWFGHRIYTKYLKEYNFVLLDWVDDHIANDERIKQGSDYLSHAVRRGEYGLTSTREPRNERTPIANTGPSIKGNSYIELNERDVDVNAYLKSVRDRHEQTKSKSRAF